MNERYYEEVVIFLMLNDKNPLFLKQYPAGASCVW